MNKENNDWISVKDRLPKDNQAVIVYVKTYNNIRYEQADVAYFRADEMEFEGFNYYFQLHEVTHWQPLPEPPKQED